MVIKVSDKTNKLGAYNVIQFGTSDLPFPTKADGKAANPDSFFGMSELGVVEENDKPFVLPTHWDDVSIPLGMLYRDLPPYNFLSIYEDMIHAVHPDSTRKIVTVFSDRGGAKTHTMLNFARIIHPEGAVHIEIGGKSFGTIFEEFGLDTQQEAVFTKRVAQAERKNEFDHTTQSIINRTFEECAGDVKDHAENEQSLTQKVEYILSHLDNGKLKDFIERISILQGWNKSSSGLNFTSRPGRIWQAILEERLPLIDEIDKAEQGTIAEFNTFLQLLTAPETIDQYIFTFQNGEQRIIRRTNDLSMDPGPHWNDELKADIYYIKPTFTVLMAGNYANDGAASNDLPQSVIDRLKPRYVEPPKAADFACVWSSKLYGMNIPMLRELHSKIAQNDKSRFADIVETIYGWGITSRQQQANHDRRPWAMAALSSVKIGDTMLGLKKLGTITAFFRDILDENSDLRKTPNMAALANDRINAAFAKRHPVSHRWVKDIFEKAIGPLPNIKAISDIAGIPNVTAEQLTKYGTGSMETIRQSHNLKHVGAFLGARLTEVIGTFSAVISAEKPVLRGVAYEKLKELGCENDPMGHKPGSLSNLLNIDPAAIFKVSPEAVKIQRAIHAEIGSLFLAARSGSIIANADPKDIVPSQPVQNSMVLIRDHAVSLKEKKWDEPHRRTLILPRISLQLELDRFKRSPFYWYDLADPHAIGQSAIQRVGQPRKPKEQRQKDQQQRQQKIEEMERATISSLILGLTLPIIKDYNLKALWTNISDNKFSEVPDQQKIVHLMTARHEHGYAYTCMAVSNPYMRVDGNNAEKGALDIVHMVWNKFRPENMILVGGLVPDTLKEFMVASGVDYFERASEAAQKSTIDKRVQDLEAVLKEKFDLPQTGDSEATKVLEQFKKAMAYRSSLRKDYDGTTLSFAQAVLQPDIVSSKPVRITADKTRPLIS